MPKGKNRPMASYRVLYAEDNPVNALIVEELLARRSDIELAVEPSGAAALARAQTWVPDLALLDQQLPDMDGNTLRLALQAQHPGLRCISLTAGLPPPPGFDACWKKPIDFGVFHAGIDRLLPPPSDE